MRRAASRIFATSLLLFGFGCASPSRSAAPAATTAPGTAAPPPGNGGSNTRRRRLQQPRDGGSNPPARAAPHGRLHRRRRRRRRPACTPSDTQLVNANAYYCTSAALGLQGVIYPYGDGMSCPYSPTTPPAKDFCAGGKCCLSGTTKVDSTFAAWGCGIGVELDDDDMTKMPTPARSTASTSR